MHGVHVWAAMSYQEASISPSPAMSWAVYILSSLTSRRCPEPWQGLGMARSVSSTTEHFQSRILGTLNSNASLFALSTTNRSKKPFWPRLAVDHTYGCKYKNVDSSLTTRPFRKTPSIHSPLVPMASLSCGSWLCLPWQAWILFCGAGLKSNQVSGWLSHKQCSLSGLVLQPVGSVTE